MMRIAALVANVIYPVKLANRSVDIVAIATAIRPATLNFKSVWKTAPKLVNVPQEKDVIVALERACRRAPETVIVALENGAM